LKEISSFIYFSLWMFLHFVAQFSCKFERLYSAIRESVENCLTF
jgi:hypothetical protein